MKGTVLVTGATGFIGRFLTRHLAAEGWHVIAAARAPDSVDWPAHIEQRILPDLGSDADFDALLLGVTHAVHLAGLAHATSSRSRAEYMAINAGAAKALALAGRRCGLRRFVLMSSVRAQSGPVAAEVLDETHEPRPTDDYGRSKLEAEGSVARALEGGTCDWVALRPVLVYGRGVKGNMRSLIKLARLPVPLPLAGLDNRRSVLSIGNLASAVAHVLERPALPQRTFLVADPTPVSVAEIVAALRQGLGRGPGMFKVPPDLLQRAFALAGLEASWQRLAGNLVVDTGALTGTGWTPAETTAEALARIGEHRAGSRPVE